MKRMCVAERRQPYSGADWCSGGESDEDDKGFFSKCFNLQFSITVLPLINLTNEMSCSRTTLPIRPRWS